MTSTGWGRTAPDPGRVLTPVHDDAEVRAVLAGAGGRGVMARGLGRSYGDAAQNAGGLVLDMTAASACSPSTPTTGWSTSTAGTSLDELMRRLVPHGCSSRCTPGTRLVTVGGAIGCRHPRQEPPRRRAASPATSCRCDLLTADGEVRGQPPTTDPDLFWATVGGMGLTGVILRATVQLQPIESSRCWSTPTAPPTSTSR